jgi:transglutaminase-like putative cysteine protease
MRIRIAHETRYTYERPARAIQQVFRLTPRDHEGQHVVTWRLEPSAEGTLRAAEDPYGNICHHFAPEGEISEFTLRVTGIVETHEAAGLVQGTVERLPDLVYLRDTELTAADNAIRVFAHDLGPASSGDTLSLLHKLLEAVHGEVAFDTGTTDVGTTAAQSFALRRGVCQDLTHIFISAARCLGVPARYASGYFRRVDGVVEQDAGHAWAEAKTPELGWVGFDPANGISTTEAHVRVAVGLDYLSVAPIRGTRRGGGSETLEVTLRVEDARSQGQSQRQS